MPKPIIEIKNISKCYKIGHQKGGYLSLREEMSNSVKSLMSRFKTGGGRFREDFWALKDVSFAVNQGEAVGIIGRNGAGKSTLLKILSQITPPTEGKITFRGRIASLLEVGTGFHPELTGRENIYLNGAILGMTRKEIANKFDEIVEFSEVEKFLDTPVKRYSSGMYVRLAFAVAAHLEPEVLVVDEVLAVGDAQFQKKCLGKMGEVASGGRTVLFVSHNMAAVRKLCQKGVVLQDGMKVFQGTSLEAVEYYYGQSNTNRQDGRGYMYEGEEKQHTHFTYACVTDGDGTPRATFFIGDDLCIRLGLRAKPNQKKVEISTQIKTALGACVYHSVASRDGCGQIELNRDVELRVLYEDIKLYPGTYYVGAWLGDSATRQKIESMDECATFVVEQAGPKAPAGLNPNHALVFDTPKWEILDVSLAEVQNA